MRPFFPSILPPEPIQKSPTIREVGRASCPINFADFNSLTILYSAMLEEGEELFVLTDGEFFIFEARKETP